jgi:tetratricopeptide (TPR) repeat protein
MTLTRPSLIKLLAPVLAFACVLAVLLQVNRSPSGGISDRGADAAAADGAALAGNTDQQIATLQRAVRAAPGKAGGYALLGDAYLQKARESGDASFYTRADGTYAAALRRDAGNVTAVIGAGTLANTRHDFRRGLRLGLEAHRLAPDLARPYTVIADAQIELGRYPAAERTIQRLVDLRPTLSSYARVSYYRELSGDLAGAAQAMRLAVSAGSGSPENVAYVGTLLGDLELARGHVGAAAVAYRQALAAGDQSDGSYPPAVAGLAKVDIARGRLARAARRLRAASDRLPLTSYLTLLAEVELARGHRAAAATVLDTVRAQQRLLRAAGAVPDAELVVFEATHGDPRAAVALGRRVYRLAPSVRSADALGWALTRSGRPRQGLIWAGRALRLGSRDPLFHFHAGMAARAAGQTALARRELRLTLSLNPGFSPWLAHQAREVLR